jgi:hypothetical protein
MMPKPEDIFPGKGIHLGDGLYGVIDYGSIVLWADRDRGRHWVTIDQSTLANFEEWIAKLRREKVLK